MCAAAFQAWTADSFMLTGPFFEWPAMLHSFQHLLMLETEFPSAAIHFEILMDKVKLPEHSVKFRENLMVLVIGPYMSGDVERLFLCFRWTQESTSQASRDLMHTLTPALLI